MADICGRITSELGELLITEAGEFIGTECSFDVCGRLITEDGFGIITESGDRIVTECFTVTNLHPGRVWKTPYPYWKPTRKPRFDFKDEEEVIIMAAMMDD